MSKRKVYVVLMGARKSSIIPIGVYLTKEAADDRIADVQAGAGKAVPIWRELSWLHATAQFVDMKEGQGR